MAQGYYYERIAMQRKLTIYYTSDVHGYFSPVDYASGKSAQSGLANCMNGFANDGNTLIIDGGDILQGSPLTYYLYSQRRDGDCVPARLLNLGGYDFVTLGNHDFNYGKAEIERYLRELDAVCLCANIGGIAGVRRIDNELQAMGQPRIFYPGEEPFIDGRDWGTLCALLNEDYHDLMNRNIVKTDSAAQLLFDRYDRAGLVAGIPPRLGLLDEGVRAKLAAILENEARAMLDEKHAGYPESFENKTIIIECARGGPDGSSMPLTGTFGYQYSLPMFCPEILENAVIL